MNRTLKIIAAAVVLVLIAFLVWLLWPRLPKSHPVATRTRQPGWTFSPSTNKTNGLGERPGEIVGIGAAMTMKDGKLSIDSVLPGSPAAAAGLHGKTFVEKIDDVETGGRKLAECVNQIRGPEGTSVRLDILESATGQRRSVEIIRKPMHYSER